MVLFDVMAVLKFFNWINTVQVGADKADRIYEDLTDMEKIRQVLQDYLDDYNTTFAKETKLVFFQDAIEHVSRWASSVPFHLVITKPGVQMTPPFRLCIWISLLMECFVHSPNWLSFLTIHLFPCQQNRPHDSPRTWKCPVSWCGRHRKAIFNTFGCSHVWLPLLSDWVEPWL